MVAVDRSATLLWTGAQAEWAKVCLCANILMSLIMIGAQGIEYQLLGDIRDNIAGSVAALERVQTRIELLLWPAQSAVWVTTVVFVLRWIYGTNLSARERGAYGLRFSPAGAVGWYFVPVYFLWRPYQAMREIWQANMNPGDWVTTPVPILLPLWWLTFWMSQFLDVTALVFWERDADTTENILLQAKEFSAIVAALLLLIIINGIHRMQGWWEISAHRTLPLRR